MAVEVALSCRAGAGVSADDSLVICDELAVAIDATYPQIKFIDSVALPRVEVTVTVAKPTAVGLQAIFVSGSGAQTVGEPMRMAIYDRTLTPETRRDFYYQFLKQNPISF